MSALNEYYEELLSLYGLLCETGAASNKWREFLESTTSSASTANMQGRVFFGRQDPNESDAQHQYSRTMAELISNSQKDGSNQKAIRRMVIAFAYALWEDEYRTKIANECDLPDKRDVKSEVFHDLNKYRQAILHASGRLDREPNVMEYVRKGEIVELSEEQIYDLFKTLINELNYLSATYYKKLDTFSIDRGFSTS